MSRFQQAWRFLTRLGCKGASSLEVPFAGVLSMNLNGSAKFCTEMWTRRQFTEANVTEATSTLGAEGPTMLSVGHFSRSFTVIYMGYLFCVMQLRSNCGGDGLYVPCVCACFLLKGHVWLCCVGIVFSCVPPSSSSSILR